MFKYLAITLVAFALLFGGAGAARAQPTAGSSDETLANIASIVSNLVTQISGISTQLAGGVNAIGLTSPTGIINVGTSDGGPLGSGSGYFQTDPARPDIIKLVLRGGEVSVQGTGPGPSGAGGSGGTLHVANGLYIGVGAYNGTDDGFMKGGHCGASFIGAVGFLPFANNIPCKGLIPPSCPGGFSMFSIPAGTQGAGIYSTCIKG